MWIEGLPQLLCTQTTKHTHARTLACKRNSKELLEEKEEQEMELVREKKQKRKKRGREGENKKEMDVTTNSKKLQSKHCINDFNNNSNIFGNSNEINYNDDEVGVFDFPWLKEGSTFQGNECLDLEDINMNTFLTYPNVCAWPPALDPFCPQTTLHEDDHSDLWSFQAEDEIKPLDCIWHAVLDQPLDLNLNKSDST